MSEYLFSQIFKSIQGAGEEEMYPQHFRIIHELARAEIECKV